MPCQAREADTTTMVERVRLSYRHGLLKRGTEKPWLAGLLGRTREPRSVYVSVTWGGVCVSVRARVHLLFGLVVSFRR